MPDLPRPEDHDATVEDVVGGMALGDLAGELVRALKRNLELDVQLEELKAQVGLLATGKVWSCDCGRVVATGSIGRLACCDSNPQALLGVPPGGTSGG